VARTQRRVPDGMGEAVSPVERDSWKVLLGSTPKAMGHAAEGMGQGTRTPCPQLRTLRIRCSRQFTAVEGSLARASSQPWKVRWHHQPPTPDERDIDFVPHIAEQPPEKAL
jgi:hypothetical protein